MNLDIRICDQPPVLAELATSEVQIRTNNVASALQLEATVFSPR